MLRVYFCVLFSWFFPMKINFWKIAYISSLSRTFIFWELSLDLCLKSKNKCEIHGWVYFSVYFHVLNFHFKSSLKYAIFDPHETVLDLSVLKMVSRFRAIIILMATFSIYIFHRTNNLRNIKSIVYIFGLKIINLR